jgi:asparagine synthetase B (glutamine-hydrolysing)
MDVHQRTGILLGKGPENRLSVLHARNVSFAATERYEIYWHGFVYWDGFCAGADSILKFAQEIESGLAAAAVHLKGVFFITIRERSSHRIYAFVDNSGLYHAFFSRRFVGTSFLEIAAHEGFQPADFDPEAVVEFLHFGCIYSGRTFFSSIRKIDPETIISLRPPFEVEILPKHLLDISKPAARSFEAMLAGFANSTVNHAVSLDLTGGVDSRLLAVVLDYFGMPFELAGSGVEGNSDLRIAAAVAETLGRDFYPTYHDPRRNDWDQVFKSCDGLFDIAKASRPLQLQQERAARGVTLAVSGAGGELFKDFWWLQDFPFYSAAKSNLPRLYATRIAPAPLSHQLFSGKYEFISRKYRQRLLELLPSYAVAGNTRTYDRIYYAFKMREFAGRFLTNSSRLLQVHAPYLDREAVQLGYSMPRRDRFFNNFHRRLITRYSPATAQLQTTEGGLSASSSHGAMLADLGKYVCDRFTRFARKAVQRFSGKTYWQENANHPQFSNAVREIVSARQSIQKLQDYGILVDSVSASQIRSSYLGTVLTLDMLVESLESNTSKQTTGSPRESVAA